MSGILSRIPAVMFPPAFAEPLPFVRTDYRALIRRNRKMAKRKKSVVQVIESSAVIKIPKAGACKYCGTMAIVPDPKKRHKCARCRREKL